MVDTTSLSTHIEALRQALDDLTRYQGRFDRRAFLGDRDAQRMVMNAMYQAVQACIDVGAHIVADKSLGRPENYREIFTILATREGLDPKVCGELERWVGLRNILAHMYWKIDLSIIFDALGRISSLESFGSFAAGYLAGQPRR